MYKKILSSLITTTLLLSLITPCYAEIVNPNSYKKKYVEFLEKVPNIENRNIIVRFNENISNNSNIGSGNIGSGNIKSGKITASSSTILSTLNKVNCSIVKTFENTNLTVIKANSDNVDDVIAQLKNDANVDLVQRDYKIVVADNGIDKYQWALQNYGQTVASSTGEEGFDINLIDAWAKTQGDEAVTVGVIDTGIDITHVDLANNIWTNEKEIVNGIDDDGNGYIDDIHGWDFANNDASVYDMDALDYHGTHMAGIIAANGAVKGVAPKIKLMPLKAMNYANGYTSDIIEAIEYAKAQGIKIINCSFASISYNPALQDAIASCPDILFICAAGNYGQPTTKLATFPTCFGLSNVLSVSAANNKGQLSEISTYGEYVDVAAPGIGIYSTLPEDCYGFMEGTSCSAAYVSGTAALLLSDNIDLSTYELKSKIINSCGDSLPKQRDNGDAEAEGHINVAAAFEADSSVGKHDDFDYTEDEGEPTPFDKYPFIFTNDNGVIKLCFDSTRQFTSFYLKAYQSTTEKEHPNFVDGQIPTNGDYLLPWVEPNITYTVAIITDLDGTTTDYTCTLKLVDTPNLKCLDFDVLAQVSYDTPQHGDNTPDLPPDVFVQDSDNVFEAEPNDSIPDADNTYDDSNTYGFISTPTDTDYYKVKFDNPGVANFWLGQIPSGVDYDLYMYDPSGALLAKSDSANNQSELIPYFSVSANIYYYLKVISSGGYSNLDAYMLRTKWYQGYSNYEANDTTETATALPGHT